MLHHAWHICIYIYMYILYMCIYIYDYICMYIYIYVIYIHIYIYMLPPLYTYLFGSMWSITKKRETRQAGGVPYIYNILYMYIYNIYITYINLRNWVILVVTFGKSSSTEQMGLAQVEGFVNGFVNGLSPNSHEVGDKSI